MGLLSFIGRAIFASVFILAAMQELVEFSSNGRPTAKPWMPKFHTFLNQISNSFGFRVTLEIKHIVAAAMVFKGLGGIFFVLGRSLGAYLLGIHLLISTPILYDFYNYNSNKPEFAQYFTKFAQNATIFGALLFFLGMKNNLAKRQPRKTLTKTKTN